MSPEKQAAEECEAGGGGGAGGSVIRKVDGKEKGNGN
jgi:hypothetical protein